MTLETLSSLFATVYMRAWYRLMGANMGHGAEISTNLAGRYDLAEVGAKNFVADEVVYGEEEIRRGWMHLEPTRTGARVFVGNDAVVPPGAVIPDDVLIGIKSKPPENAAMSPGETWFGSPPIRLPARQKVDLGSTRPRPTSSGAWPKIRRGVFEAFATSPADALHHPRDHGDRLVISTRPSWSRTGGAGLQLRRGERRHRADPVFRRHRDEMAALPGTVQVTVTV